ncbi:hypothetical protein S245_051091, partial [Arachis hypogaea]
MHQTTQGKEKTMKIAIVHKPSEEALEVDVPEVLEEEVVDLRGGKKTGPNAKVGGKIGHIALQYYHRFNQNFTNPQQQSLNVAPLPSMEFHNTRQAPQSSQQSSSHPSVAQSLH